MPQPAPTLGIIAGGGRLPAQLAEHCQSIGRDFFVLAFEESADIDAIRHVPHAVVRLGAVGEAIEQLKNAGAKELVMAGKVKRPSFLSLRPDAGGARLMARMGTAFFSGDDALLKAIVAFLEEEGFTVVGSDDLLGGLLAPVGILGKIRPSRQDETDIAHGLKVAKTLGELDIGQAVIVENGYVLGVEGAEGTDALIARCAELKREARGGVLIKAKKPAQEARVDLPTIGVLTVEKIHAAGFAGIAIEADGGIILDRDTMIERADALGIFVVGVRHG
jgi:DUF1009 family protein